MDVFAKTFFPEDSFHEKRHEKNISAYLKNDIFPKLPKHVRNKFSDSNIYQFRKKSWKCGEFKYTFKHGHVHDTFYTLFSVGIEEKESNIERLNELLLNIKGIKEEVPKIEEFIGRVFFLSSKYDDNPEKIIRLIQTRILQKEGDSNVAKILLENLKKPMFFSKLRKDFFVLLYENDESFLNYIDNIYLFFISFLKLEFHKKIYLEVKKNTRFWEIGIERDIETYGYNKIKKLSINEIEKFKLNKFYPKYSNFIISINKIQQILETFNINLRNMEFLNNHVKNYIIDSVRKDEEFFKNQIFHDLNYFKLTLRRAEEFQKFIDSFLSIKNIFTNRILTFFLGLITFVSVLQIFSGFFKSIAVVFYIIPGVLIIYITVYLVIFYGNNFLKKMKECLISFIKFLKTKTFFLFGKFKEWISKTKQAINFRKFKKYFILGGKHGYPHKQRRNQTSND